MFTFNGTDFSTLLKVSDIRRPIIGSQSLTTMKIPGMDGEVFVRRQTDAYKIEVDIALIESSLSDISTKKRTIAEKLFSDTPVQLIFYDEPDVYFNAILSDDSVFTQLFYLGKTTLKFYVPDPFKYLVSNSGDVLTVTTTGTTAFTRIGNTDSYPRVEIQGVSGASGYFTIETDNNQMTFTGTLLAGETLVIDSNDLTAYIIKTDGTQVSAIRNLDNLGFLILTKGANNFTILKGGGATLTQCVLRYNSRWL